MNIKLWRLSYAKFASTLWTGEGARLFGGRWNSKGTAVVYTAATKSLEALEQLVHLVPPRLLDGYVFASITIAKKQIQEIKRTKLPTGWDGRAVIAATQLMGDRWAASAKTLAVAVPSVVMPGEFNYLINPAHPDFPAAVKSSPEPFSHGRRLA